MGLFSAPIRFFENYIRHACEDGRLRELPRPKRAWPAGSTLVLGGEMGCELGNPAIGSAFAIVWSGSQNIGQGRVWLAGPDLAELKSDSAPFGMFLLLRAFIRKNEYECYVRARDAIGDLKLNGLTMRILPARQSAWCRVGRERLKRECGFAEWGGAVLKIVRRLDFVRGADVLFVSERGPEWDELTQVARQAGQIIGALKKMSEEKHFDCEGCDYAEICEAVEEMRKIRSRLIKESTHA